MAREGDLSIGFTDVGRDTTRPMNVSNPRQIYRGLGADTFRPLPRNPGRGNGRSLQRSNNRDTSR